ncbi:MAG: DUF488 domain-containing protein [Aeromonas salmonicida]
MALAIVRLGSPRLEGEGLRIGTVRRPPRGVPKQAFASQDWYDSSDTMKLGQAADTPALWAVFCKQYKAEMATPCARHDLALLAALSHTTNLSVGCYCEQASRCHRSILQELLVNCGAKLR